MHFVTVVNSQDESDQAKFMIESLRSFGGEFSDSTVWVFYPGEYIPENLGHEKNVESFPLKIEAAFQNYELADKVFACARAEEVVGSETSSLGWINLDCLFVNPPVLFELGTSFDAALRPVHLRNVGSTVREPLDDYWRSVYSYLGMKEVGYSVESFVDCETLRPYFNTHCFSINPALGILQDWREAFKELISNRAFQSGPCQDELHRVFLHQVVLSALVTRSIPLNRIRMLPPEYSYPLHLHDQIPPERRFQFLNSTVCTVYEQANGLTGMEITEPLSSWLKARR